MAPVRTFSSIASDSTRPCSRSKILWARGKAKQSHSRLVLNSLMLALLARSSRSRAALASSASFREKSVQRYE